jgi:hypothetical protein
VNFLNEENLCLAVAATVIEAIRPSDLPDFASPQTTDTKGLKQVGKKKVVCSTLQATLTTSGLAVQSSQNTKSSNKSSGSVS